MHKKGQITTFIIIGIIILAIIALFLYLRQGAQPIAGQPSVSSEIGPVQTFVTNCLESTSEKGVLHNSLQGGYYENFEQDVLPMPGAYYVPVYFDGLSVAIPTDEKIKEELQAYVQDNLHSCLNNFQSLQGFTVAEEENVTITNMVIGGNKVSVQYNYPLLINGESRLDTFVTEHNLRLGMIRNEVTTLVGESQLMPDLLCTSCYIDSGINNDLTFDTLDFGSFSVIIIKDETTNPALQFAYAVKLVRPIPA